MEDHGHNESVDSEDTSHDDWYSGFEEEFGLEHSHRADTDARLGSAVRGSEIYEGLIFLMLTGEDEGAGDSDVSEELELHVGYKSG